MSEPAVDVKLPQKVSGEKPDRGHMDEFEENFARFLMRCNAECGELAKFNMVWVAAELGRIVAGRRWR